MVLAAVTGLIATVDGPACALLGNDLVPREDVPSAIAVGSVVHSVGRVAGTALAGVTVAFFGIGGAYAANGVSFLCVVAVIPLLSAASAESTDGVAVAVPETGLAAPLATEAEVAEAESRMGIGYFFTRRNLVILAALSAVSSILGRNYGLTLAALVTGPMHGSMKQYALISTVLAIGGTAGAVLAGRLRTPSVPLVAGLTLTGALLQSAGALSPDVVLLVVLVAPMAVAESLCDTATTTILQTDPPPHLRGRVLGAWRSMSTGWQLIGPPLLGLLIQVLGARGCLFAGGLAIAATIGVGIVLGNKRSAGASGRRRAARLPMIAVAAHGPGCTVEACLAGCAA
jgi:hypothetical protein